MKNLPKIMMAFTAGLVSLTAGHSPKNEKEEFSEEYDPLKSEGDIYLASLLRGEIDNLEKGDNIKNILKERGIVTLGHSPKYLSKEK